MNNGKRVSWLIWVALFSTVSPLSGQSAVDYAVLLDASVQQSPPSITLTWTTNVESANYFISKKEEGATSWSILGLFPGTDTSYTDTAIVTGKRYEYRLQRLAGSYSGFGYICSGIEAAPLDEPYRILLVVDTSLWGEIGTRIIRMKDDLRNEGWEPVLVLVHRNDPVPDVKARMVAEWQKEKDRTQAAILIGRVPVPYSGAIYPDGHTNHQGAWPADVYYADMDGTWTDATVNITSAAQARHHNLPGDGKFDQSTLPSDLELMIGRIDFDNMPAFPKSEAGLLKDYLDKNHLYRNGGIPTIPRAIIDDNFGAFNGEAFSASAWRSLSPILGRDSIISADYRTELNAAPYQWSYGCGGGSYTSAGGIGNTSNFASDSLQTIFTMLFGSYFGDWDSPDNLLRAAVASGTTLTNAWSGRPHWHFHHMGMGYPIGYSTRLSQNNSGHYHASFAARGIHIALIGDPTLKQHPLQPSGLLSLYSDTLGIHLSWEPSPDAAMGYHIYRSHNTYGPFERATVEPVFDTFYLDACAVYPDTFHYLVRPVRLETSPSGTFINVGPGSYNFETQPIDSRPVAAFQHQISGLTAHFTNLSSNASTYLWDFGDGTFDTVFSPVKSYSVHGHYTVTLIAVGPCLSDTFSAIVVVDVVGTGNGTPDPVVRIFPNPANEHITVEFGTDAAPFRLDVIAVSGKPVWQYSGFADQGKVLIPLAGLPSGLYTVRSVWPDGRAATGTFVKSNN
jgi:hypothetical protein